MNLKEEVRGTQTTSKEHNSFITDQENEPIDETRIGEVKFPLIKDLTAPWCSSEASFLWPSSVNYKYRCIYRVPRRLRRVNPEAYTPQMLLIGPLSKTTQTLELSKTDLRYSGYQKMEQHKKKYVENIALKYGEETINEFKRIIKRDEQIIRSCYSESTDWIDSEHFVDMMLHDSVFILVFLSQLGPQYIKRTGDFLFDEPCHQETILDDLILLENQVPYALLENLFDPFFIKLQTNLTFRDTILGAFELERKIKKEVKFLHFTDLFRRVRVETLGLINVEEIKPKLMIKNLYNAVKLDSAGVQFKRSKEEDEEVEEVETSLMIKFEDGILTMPCLTAEDNTEMILRNLMALEQCHYSYNAFVCDYIIFLDFLIDTDKDVDFLVNKGVIRNWLGHSESVAKMVNNLCLGIIDYGSHYYNLSKTLNNHYKSRVNRSISTLQQVYFKDLWTGTAHMAAVVLLVLTLIQTVASILQVKQDDNKPH